ncbi:MAG: homocysteine S-methyltransferase family protein [Pseudonocardiaceae bacterium]|nr:homocysteine S-methyltransferase family protein [Pseudonocardiaceae bacterium]
MAPGRSFGSSRLERRFDADPVICAEGYLFELERRGYLQAGAFVPEVVLEHPSKVLELHREFARAGSDVVLALTFYAHRDKLRVVGREDALAQLNLEALSIASRVAQETDGLLAGNICNTHVFQPGDAAAAGAAREMFQEQVAWAVEGGADLVVAESFAWAEEARIAAEVISDAGLPAVVTISITKQPTTLDGLSAAEACRHLEGAGAAVVGLNCLRGPTTMLPLLADIREAVDCHVAALPVVYRTTPEHPSFVSLEASRPDLVPQGRPFPTALDPFTCDRYEVAEFARQAHDLGVDYIGLCCGAAPHHVRSLAEAIGRRPEASRYSADLSKHAFLGSAESVGRAASLDASEV